MANPGKLKGRGTGSRVDPRYLAHTREGVDDGWHCEEDPGRVTTTVTVEHPRTIISRNRSPDVPFEVSVNPYRGCEHGCIYCYARPTHAYLDLSPGIDFESRLFAKPDAPDLLRRELGKPGYRCTPLAMGTNTDPYQPIERRWEITRRVLEVLSEARHPLSIVTKASLVERDIDILAPMAERGLVQIYLSVTSLDNDLARRLEPRAAAPARRLETLARLHGAGIPVGVMFAPVIPFINDADMEAVLEQAVAAGAESAGYVMLRLPHEIKQLFRDWLKAHAPDRETHVMNVISDLRGGRENDPRFHSRMRGTGHYADLIRQRFQHACRRLGLNRKHRELDTTLFIPPGAEGVQQTLF
ncbi:MAG: PA0069 family radical SAM protein [Gammaproteobacteria bacterium]